MASSFSENCWYTFNFRRISKSRRVFLVYRRPLFRGPWPETGAPCYWVPDRLAKRCWAVKYPINCASILSVLMFDCDIKGIPACWQEKSRPEAGSSLPERTDAPFPRGCLLDRPWAATETHPRARSLRCLMTLRRQEKNCFLWDWSHA